MSEAESKSHHPPLARLLTFYHRTLSEEELPGVVYHLKRCPECQEKLHRIELTVGLFGSSSQWRRACPSTGELYQHASFELKAERSKEVQEHIMTCYTCREEMLVFRDLRQSLRVGRSSFLSPQNWLLRTSYWRTRGVVAWLLQPRWRAGATVVLRGMVGVVALAGAYQLTQLDWSTLTDRTATAPKKKTDTSAETEETQGPRTVVLPVEQRTRYYFVYDARGLRTLLESHAAARWAAYQIDAEQTPVGIFKVLDPPGEEGMIVVRPIQPLAGPQLAQLEARLSTALQGPARLQLQAWAEVRNTLQQETGGPVLLMTAPPKRTLLEEANKEGAPSSLRAPSQETAPEKIPAR